MVSRDAKNRKNSPTLNSPQLAAVRSDLDAARAKDAELAAYWQVG